ncbi:MAG: hypothetical protein ACFFG0_47975 [Candidatus Thorarchaeota archaeon]
MKINKHLLLLILILAFLGYSRLPGAKNDIIVENAKRYITLWSTGDIYEAVERYWDVSYFVNELLGSDIKKIRTHEKIYLKQITQLFLKTSLSAKPILSLLKKCKFEDFKFHGNEHGLSIVSFNLVFPNSNTKETKRIYFQECSNKWKIVDVMNEGKRMTDLLKQIYQTVKKNDPNFNKITLFEIYLLNALKTKLKLDGVPEKVINQ